jgi:2-amino-4-hydroxy-6-hydroxymethyldihydropteridine diphosphokinase
MVSAIPWFPAYIGVGSNLEDPVARVRAALDGLRQLPATLVVHCSALFGSRPMGPVSQPDFCNAVAAVLTQLPVSGFFMALRALELQLGRLPPRERWGPRLIDLDLLVFGNLQQVTAELSLPHPGIVQRNFVLYPLAEVAPDLLIPGAGRVAELARKVSSEGIWRV